MNTATVYDFTPSQLHRTVKKSTKATETTQAVSILDDMADAIEATHQCANLAGFSERPRAFIFALATAARSQSCDQVELCDKDLAELQGCSERTIIRQRQDYLKESKAKNFDLVEIVEGEFDKESKRNAPTKYRFHVGGVVEMIVTEARSAPDWHRMSRKQQRDAIKRAAVNVYDEIPEAPPRRRKKKRPRLATAEIKTCQKVIETKFETLKDRASKLPLTDRERLLNPETPGELCQWYLDLRSRMDSFFGVDSCNLLKLKNITDVGDNLSPPPPLSA